MAELFNNARAFVSVECFLSISSFPSTRIISCIPHFDLRLVATHFLSHPLIEIPHSARCDSPPLPCQNHLTTTVAYSRKASSESRFVRRY